MAVKSTSGLKFYMSGTTTPATITATAITNAQPAVVTAADTTGMADGQMVTMSGTDMASLDGKTFIVASLTATSFALTGSDATGDTAAAKGTGTYYDTAVDLVALCLSSIAINAETSSPISVSTFCDQSATIPGPSPQAPSLSLSFYLDTESAGYCALLAAEADGNARMMQIVFPGNGDLVMNGVIASVDFEELPLEGSVSLKAEAVLTSKPMHRFDCP